LILTTDEQYMARCIDLANRAYNAAAPNPMVGAVLVYEGRIIGEGYHEQYGAAHAEVNAVRSVKAEDRFLIPQSTLYVSLEPCSFHGNTPPCTQLILDEKIPKVVIGCLDPHPKVSGRGVELLKIAGVQVRSGVLEQECLHLNRKAFTSYIDHRPYICLKWAETQNGLFAPLDRARTMISNEYVRYQVHDWRRQYHGILVGFQTAFQDNPALTNRYWEGGKQPIRIVLDPKNELPVDLQIFDGKVPAIVVNTSAYTSHNEAPIQFVSIPFHDKFWPIQLMEALHEHKVQSVFIEGGIKTHQAFLNLGLWDEIIQIKGKDSWEKGLSAPKIYGGIRYDTYSLQEDSVNLWKHERNNYII